MSKKETTIGDVIDCIADNNTLTYVEIWREPVKLLWEGKIENFPDALRNLKDFTFWTCFERITFDLNNKVSTIGDVVNLIEGMGSFFVNDRFGRTLWYTDEYDISKKILKISDFKVDFYNGCLVFTV